MAGETLRQDEERGAVYRGEGEQQLRNLADNLPDGMIYQLLAEGDERRFLYVSRGVESLFGVSPEAALADAMALYRLIEPAFVPGLAAGEAASLASGRPFRAEVAVRRPDGARRWLQLNSARRVRADGSTVWDGIALDVTDRKEAEAERERTERRLEIATSAAGIGIWDWNPQTNDVVYSERAKAIMGLPAGQPVSFAQLTAVTHPDDLPNTRAASRRAIDPAVRSDEIFRYRIHRADTGELRWVLARGVASFSTVDGREVATSYIGTLLDITDELAAEQALVESEARLRLAVEASEMAVWETEIGQGTITQSPQLNRMFGFPPDAQVTVEDLRTRYAPGEGERMEREGAEVARRGGTSIQTEFRIVWPDGSEHWLLLRAAIAPGASGAGRRVIGVLIDITGRKLAEERTRLVARELQHRVKNSLAIVQTIANQSFRGKTDLAAATDVFFGRLGALAAATDAVTAENWADADLAQVVTQVLKPFRDSSTDSFVIEGEPVLVPSKTLISIALALHELATNAVKYGALSEPGGRVHICWTLVGGTLTLGWREADGPPVTPPSARGFGTRMLERGLFGSSGTVDLRFDPDGLVCTMTAVL